MDLRVRQTAEELSLAPTDAAGREALSAFTLTLALALTLAQP